jgi:hypothetical protein
MSYANVQFSARDVYKGFGLYLNTRGLNNGTSIESLSIYDKIGTMQTSYSIDILHSDNEIRRSGASFGLNKTLFKYMFVGAAAGYCDVLEYQKTTLKPYTVVLGNKNYTGDSYIFDDQSSTKRNIEWEVIVGATPQWERFYIPIYCGWSYNYTGFFGIGIGYKL